MCDDDRRNFLLTSRDLMVGALAAGTLACAAGSGPSVVNAQNPTPSNVAAFGWEINNLGVGGGAVYLPLKNSVVLKTVDVDMSFSPLSAPSQPGFADVLCRGQVSRGGPPTFTGAEVNYFPPAAPQLGPPVSFNPGSLQLGMDGFAFQDTFLNVILKAWITTEGTASQTDRHVQISPSLNINAGDYIVFTMSGGEIVVDAEMQIVMLFG
jgi:hypothetical protein